MMLPSRPGASSALSAHEPAGPVEWTNISRCAHRWGRLHGPVATLLPPILHRRPHRHVHLAGTITNPIGAWTTQQACKPPLRLVPPDPVPRWFQVTDRADPPLGERVRLGACRGVRMTSAVQQKLRHRNGDGHELRRLLDVRGALQTFTESGAHGVPRLGRARWWTAAAGRTRSTSTPRGRARAHRSHQRCF